MPRGGKRIGSGRKPIVDWDTLFLIGQDCESEWRTQWSKRLEKAISSDPRFVDYHSIVERINGVPIKERKGMFDSCGEPKLERAQQHRFDVETELRCAAGIVDENSPAPRLFSYSVARPYRSRGAIIEKTWIKWSTRIGPTLTKRRVEVAWKAYRDFEKDVRAVVANHKPNPENAWREDELAALV